MEGHLIMWKSITTPWDGQGRSKPAVRQFLDRDVALASFVFVVISFGILSEKKRPSKDKLQGRKLLQSSQL